MIPIRTRTVRTVLSASLRPRAVLRVLPWLVAAAAAAWAGAATPVEAFHAENAAAMDRMMAAMDVKPSGDIDRDFAAMMIPHHQGAIDMALAELRYGRNEQLRRIAQEIIVEQQQEIAAMQLAIGAALPPSGPAPTQVGTAPTSTSTTPSSATTVPASAAATARTSAHHHSK